MDEHQKRMNEILQREQAYRQRGVVDIEATHDDIDYLFTRVKILETNNYLLRGVAEAAKNLTNLPASERANVAIVSSEFERRLKILAARLEVIE